MELPAINNLKGAKNIGATINKRLNEIGIFTLADLAGVTPVMAYMKICEHNPGKTFPVCYYLYSLQGALMHMHWDDLPDEMKKDLRKQAMVLKKEKLNKLSLQFKTKDPGFYLKYKAAANVVSRSAAKKEMQPVAENNL